MANQPRMQRYTNLTVHHKGDDGAEYLDKYKDVTVTFHPDGWTDISRDQRPMTAYPPGMVIKLSFL